VEKLAPAMRLDHDRLTRATQDNRADPSQRLDTYGTID
jgi:hypothetical protein